MSILNSYLVTSRLLRPFDPREYNTPNCSKTERHGVQKEEDESLPLFSFTLRRGRCSCGGSADLSALCKCAVLLRNIRILIENLLFK